MSETRQIPTLRFSEFSDNWKNTQLNEIANFYKGKNISKSDIVKDGKIECIRYGELYTDYGEVIEKIISKTSLPKTDLVFSKANDIIIPSSGETQLDIATASCVLKNDVALGGDLNIIRTKQNGIFISYYLNSAKKRKIASLAQGNSVVHLYNNQLASLYLNLPQEKEQQKIASFLSSVDKKIELLQQKKRLLEDYKKGVMQKIFSQGLRFKPENGNEYLDWEEKKLGEIGTFFSGGTPKSTNKKYYEGDISFIGSGNISDNSVQQFITLEAIENSSAKMIEKGDLLYALYGATSGEVAISKIKGAINQAVLCIRTDENKFFLFQLLKYRKNSITSKFLQGGQGNLSANILKKLRVNLPSKEEQTQIANFLSAIDEKIQLVSSQIESTTAFKKGLLQQMFV